MTRAKVVQNQPIHVRRIGSMSFPYVEFRLLGVRARAAVATTVRSPKSLIN